MADRLRIVHCFRAPVGGLFRHVLDLSGAQAAAGHDVGYVIDSTVADALTEQRLVAASEHLRLGIIRLPMGRLPSLRDIATSNAISDALAELGADVLHGHGAKGGAYARLAARRLRRDGRDVVTFYTPHGGSLHYAPLSPQGLIYTAIERYLRRSTDGLIFESDFIKRAYEERIGRGSVPARAITNALQPTDFTPHQPDADAADFLFIGELRQLKGVDVLLRALAEISVRQPARLVIVGGGRDREALEKLAAELGLGQAVEFTGPLPAQAAFPRGRCLVVPSRAESMPYIVLEAAAAGMPLLATSVGGIPEIVSGSDTPLLPPGDVTALANAMQDYLDAPDVARDRASRLRVLVGQGFTIEKAAEAVVDFYRQRLADNLNRKA